MTRIFNQDFNRQNQMFLFTDINWHLSRLLTDCVEQGSLPITFHAIVTLDGQVLLIRREYSFIEYFPIPQNQNLESHYKYICLHSACVFCKGNDIVSNI